MKPFFAIRVFIPTPPAPTNGTPFRSSGQNPPKPLFQHLADYRIDYGPKNSQHVWWLCFEGNHYRHHGRYVCKRHGPCDQSCETRSKLMTEHELDVLGTWEFREAAGLGHRPIEYLQRFLEIMFD